MDFLLFQILPYFAVLVMIGGGIYRIKTMPYTASSKSSELLEKRGLPVGSNLFHIGILVLFFGHVFGMLTPVSVINALGIAYSTKQMIAITLGGGAAAMCFIGLLLLVKRRFGNNKVLANSSFGDKFVIILILIQLTVGMLSIKLSLKHPGGEETMVFLAWASGLLRFDSNAYMVVMAVNPLFKLHFLLGITIFASLPFTRLIHIFRVPLLYPLRPFLLIRRKI